MNETAFSFDPDWMGTLTAPFMTNAFLAGLCIALAAGVMGYFTIARHSTFAAHALALGATLVTNNLREFERVPGLAVENWC